jgi:hypothetical protein
MMALMEIYSNCANVLKKYFLPPIHDDLSYICRKVVVKFTPNYFPYNILPSMQHFCDAVQLPVSVVILKLLHQTRYNMQSVRMKDMNAVLCHVNRHSYKGKRRNSTSYISSYSYRDNTLTSCCRRFG